MSFRSARRLRGCDARRLKGVTTRRREGCEAGMYFPQSFCLPVNLQAIFIAWSHASVSLPVRGVVAISVNQQELADYWHRPPFEDPQQAVSYRSHTEYVRAPKVQFLWRRFFHTRAEGPGIPLKIA